MRSREEVELLRQRALTFLGHAEEALERSEYDFCAFACEQSAQLYLKAALLDLLGEIPKVHRVRELLSLISESVPEARDEVSSFVRERRVLLRMLDEAYITARYLTMRYERDEAASLLDLAGEIMEVVDEL